MQKNMSNKPGVYINSSITNQVKSSKITVSAGSRSTMATVMQNRQFSLKPGFIRTNSPAARELLIPENSYRGCLKHDRLGIGPIVGVLTIANALGNKYSYPGGKKARMFKEMASYALERGVLVYYFSPYGVNERKQVIKGYYLDDKKKWSTALFPYPDIVYNRILSRNTESQAIVKRLLSSFHRNPDMYVFNSRFLNKWEVYEAISKYPEAISKVPESIKYSRENLRDMLKKHREVFLKPLHGSKGEGIVMVKSINQNTFAYARFDSLKWVKCNSLIQLHQELKKLHVNEVRYLIQQAIDLPRYKERVYDFRTQVQKNGEGKWVFTGCGVRIAGKNRFVTHIPNGGSMASLEQVISKDDYQRIKDVFESQMKEICLIIPRILEKELKINLGILSMDIGMDSKEKLLILEVNSKPASFDEDHIRKQHLEYLVDYFIYIGQKKYKRDDN